MKSSAETTSGSGVETATYEITWPIMEEPGGFSLFRSRRSDKAYVHLLYNPADGLFAVTVRPDDSSTDLGFSYTTLSDTLAFSLYDHPFGSLPTPNAGIVPDRSSSLAED